MDNRNVKVLQNEFLKNLNLLNEEFQKINNMLENVKVKTSEMNKYWQGNDSDLVSQAINKFTMNFDNINEQNKKYVLFLEKTIEKYQVTDDKISQEAANASGLNINSN